MVAKVAVQPVQGVATDDTMGDADGWTAVALPYQDTMGQCTLQAARELVSLLHAHKALTAESYVMDNGCGGGSITRALKAAHPEARVLATDVSKGMVDSVLAVGMPGVDGLVSDATTLDGVPDGAFSHVTTSAMIQFTPDPAACMRHMHRVLAPCGQAAIGIWGAGSQMFGVHMAAGKAALPEYQERRPVRGNSWDVADEHEVEMRKAGFKEVSVKSINVDFPVKDAEALGEWWRSGKNPVIETWIAHFESQGGERESLCQAVERVTREQWDDGRGVYMEVIIGMGSK